MKIGIIGAGQIGGMPTGRITGLDHERPETVTDLGPREWDQNEARSGPE